MNKNHYNQNSINSQWVESEGTVEILLPKILDEKNVSFLWAKFTDPIRSSKFKTLKINANEVEYCNGIGVALLYQWKKDCTSGQKEFLIDGLKKEFYALISNFENSELGHQIHESEEKQNTLEFIGHQVEEKIKKLEKTIEFIGETSVAFLKFLKNPIKNVRWGEVLIVSEKSGVDALVIIVLIGFLLGLIMSFQSAIPMQKFGAEIFVANLVGLSMFRELGPLMTAIILAGRSGSSFAAEIGTMKVSEELDALNTMGLNSIQFLILPRMIAGMIVSPILTIFLNLAGLVGSCLVIMSLGYPLVTFTKQVASSVDLLDLFSGLFKSVVFGLLVAGIGCASGINTKEGASAVGESTTSSVVTGIIVISITDGFFSIAFYYLGI
ncbi:MAG: ABC transporter permease [Leptospiraceae bacterium]|nr:ABC transporter permease [Leptospiraceae bacterium]MCP5512940.1 ABC transporter permease [Leptospiraceae bacterium]